MSIGPAVILAILVGVTGHFGGAMNYGSGYLTEALFPPSDEPPVAPVIAVSGTRPVDFAHDVQPIFAKSCYECHGPDKKKGGLRLDARAFVMKGGGSGPTRMNAIQCTSAGCSQLVAPGNDGSLELDMRRVTFVEGALQVEAIDPHSAHVLWSAINRGTVRRSDARQNRLDAIAAQTLAGLPAR